MGLWSYFNRSGGYFEPVTSRWSVKVELLEPSLQKEPSLGASGLGTRIPAMPGQVIKNVSLELSNKINNLSSGNESDQSVLSGELSTEAYVIFIVLYTATTVTSILGNIISIIIFARGKRSKTELRPFLINLAVADLIMAIFCIPFTFTNQLLNEWIFSKPMCPIVLFLQTVSVTASVSTNMAIGIDRFYAVAFPLKSRITASRYRLVIAIIWIISILLNAVQLKVGQAKERNMTHILDCNEDWGENEILRNSYSLFVLFLTYIIPLTILTVTYSIVGRLLWRRIVPGNADAARDQMQLKSTRKVVKMLVTIVLFFGLCWLPLHTFFLTLEFNPQLKVDEELLPMLTIIYFVSHWIAMSNSFVNPLIYGFMNDNYRADLRNILFQICPYVSSSRQRHGALRRKTRGHGQDDDLSFTSDFPLNIKLLQRTATTATMYKNGGVGETPTKSNLGKTSSSKSY